MGTSLGVHVLRQVVAGTPLGWWEAQAPIAHLIVLAAEHELGPVLLSGWGTAAIRQRYPPAGPVSGFGEAPEPGLVAVLEPVDLVRLAADVGAVDQVLAPVALAAFEALPSPWPAQVRVGVIEAVTGLFAQRRVGRHQAPSLRRLAEPATLRCSGEVAVVRRRAGPAAPARRRARRPGRPALLPRRPAGRAGRGRSSMTTDAGPVLRPHAEEEYAEELEALAKSDAHPRPPHWQLSPWAVVTYLLGGTLDDGTTITPKYIGPRRVVEVAVATLATDRALLLLWLPGTAKTWMSEHLAARRSPATRRCSSRGLPAPRRRRCATAGTTPGC